MTKPNLKDKIAVQVSHAIQGTVEYPISQKVDLRNPNSAVLIKEGMDGYYANRTAWINLTTEHILEEIIQSLPPEIDIASKYETDGNGVYINLDTKNKSQEQNQEQLEFLASYADDRGWNRFREELIITLRRLQNGGKVKHHVKKR